MPYEYKIVECPNNTGQAVLKRWLADGWEFCMFIGNKLYIKRAT